MIGDGRGWPQGRRDNGDADAGGAGPAPPPPPPLWPTAATTSARVAPASPRPLPELLRPPPPAGAAASSSSSSRAVAALQRAPSADDPALLLSQRRAGRRESGGSSRSEGEPPSFAAEAAAAAAAAAPGRASGTSDEPPLPPPAPSSSSPPFAAPSNKKRPSASRGGREWPRWRVRLLSALDSTLATSALLALTLFAILQEDCKYALLPAEADVYVESATAAAVAVLLSEIALSSLVRPRFFLSFYFWLDTLATLSLGFEIPALRAALGVGPSAGADLGDLWLPAAAAEDIDGGGFGSGANASSSSLSAASAADAALALSRQLPGFVDLGAPAPTAGLHAAGEQALVWAKAGRAVKVLRLVRALQQQRAWRQQRRARRAAAEALSPAERGGGGGGKQSGGLSPEEEADNDVVERYRYVEARVGHRLQELTVRRLAVGLLATVAALALLDAAGRAGPAFGAPAPAPGYAGLRMLHAQVAEGVSAALEREFGIGLTAAALVAAGGGDEPADAAVAVAAAAAAAATSAPGFEAALGAFEQTVEYRLLGAGARGRGGNSASRPLLLVVANVTLVPHAPSAAAASTAAAAAAAVDDRPGRGNGTRRRYLEIEGAILRAEVCATSSSLGLISPDPQASPQQQRHCATLVSAAMLDARSALAARSAAGVARTLLLAALLAAGSHLVQRDTRELVLAPVERMVARVRAMADDPLAAFAPKADGGGGGNGGAGAGQGPPALGCSSADADDSPNLPPIALPACLGGRRASAAAGSLLLRRRIGRRRSFWGRQDDDDDDGNGNGSSNMNGPPPGQYETRLLEDAIQRVCSLLAVSFGEAGAEIIGDNLRRGGAGAAGGGSSNGGADGSSASVAAAAAAFDPMVPGRRVVAVFGFCDIRRFTDATEVLGEGVMEFVNAVAALVHGAAAARGGAPNKNVGDAFLLVWKLPRGLRPGDAAVGVESQVGGGGGGGGGGEQCGGGRERRPGGASDGLAGVSAAAAAAAGGEKEDGASLGGVGREIQGLAAALDAQRVANRALFDVAESSSSGRRASAAAAAAAAAAAQQRCRSRSPSSSLVSASGGGGGAGGALSPPAPPRRSLLAALAGAGDARLSGAFTGGPKQLHQHHLQQQQQQQEQQQQPIAPAALEAARRSVLLCRDVRQLPLSAPAKAALVRSVADGALAAFCLTRAAMAASERLRRYEERGDLRARMALCASSSSPSAAAPAPASSPSSSSPRPPAPYRVQMGFGLHVGWAIEGAIGSRHKVDASYLSPHVNLASRLEAASKQFRVPLLASRAFWACLSPAVRRRARLLDRVVVRGSAAPLEVYTYDLDVPAALEAWLASVAGAGGGGKGGGGGNNSNGDDRLAQGLLERRAGDEWDEHPALTGSWRLTPAWKARFDAGVAAYLGGDWPAARRALEQCRRLPTRCRGGGGGAAAAEEQAGHEEQEEQGDEDGPTAVLLEVMAAHAFVAPAGWRGYRELTEK